MTQFRLFDHAIGFSFPLEPAARVADAIWERAEDETLDFDAVVVRLWEAFKLDALDRVRLRQIVPAVWQASDYPARRLGQKAWLEMFEACGYMADCHVEWPVRVWRGAALTAARGFSWTWDFDVAREAAIRAAFDAMPSDIFEIEVERDQVLAVATRREPEVIVNPWTLSGRRSPRAVTGEPRGLQLERSRT